LSTSKKLGEEGEQLARACLESKGWSIEKTNWRFGRTEIDIIATKDQIRAFVEVKTRFTSYFGAPSESVTKNKQRIIVTAANAYLESKTDDFEIRFDVISIVKNSQNQEITHIENAFQPRW